MKFQSNNSSSLVLQFNTFTTHILPLNDPNEVPFVALCSKKLKVCFKLCIFQIFFAIYIWMPRHFNVCMFVFIIVYTWTIQIDILHFNVCIFVRIFIQKIEWFLLEDLLKLQLHIQMHADFIKNINWYGLCVSTQVPTTSSILKLDFSVIQYLA